MKNEMKNKKNKRRRVLLVAPRHPENFWNLEGMLPIFGAKTLMPNAALATLKALTPAELTIEYILCDENISPIDFNTSCDLAAVTGYTLHAERVRELCKAFRQKGIPVALGGAYATIEADKCKGLADYHFIGEAEYTWPQFLKEWERGEPKPEYEQKAYIDMKDSPGPDWSLVDPGDYVHYSIQTSRGCPNKCDFCDVIQYQGRKYRTKRTDQVLQEIKDVHAQGVPAVFFSDDNFTGNKKYTRELLAKIIEWNRAQAQPLLFTTQATVEVADDEELLRMFADANFTGFFLGVETTRKESLEEVHKTHNIRHDIYERMSRLSRYGLIPLVGLIVGFDHDDETVFDELYGFIDRANAPTVGISLLNAPP
ncbi:MAG: B12-binding domain-containing radical SAM protein, partial [bacterium]|nr:B12-binding domain-containing radical SAM protein [bacterium]